MGTYLTQQQIDVLRDELSLHYALPWAADLAGTSWEQMLAEAKGGEWSGGRGNRPDPDVIAPEGGHLVRFSVKTEGVECTRARNCAEQFLGYHEDFIMARPKVDELLVEGESFNSLAADDLGRRVLTCFNERVVDAYRWDAVAFMLRVQPNDPSVSEFIYWEERPAPRYDPDGYWWIDTGRATGTNRNIAAFPLDVERSETMPMVHSTFRWTSGGKQLYAVHEIPRDADIIEVPVVTLTKAEAREALIAAVEQKAANQD
jgi:hypothetical protein